MIRVGFEVYTEDIDLMPFVCDLGSDLLDQLLENLNLFEDGLKIPFPDPNYREMMESMGGDLKSVIHEEFQIYGFDRIIAGVYSDDPRMFFIEYGTGLWGEGPGHVKKEIVAAEVGNKQSMFVFEIDGEKVFLRKHRGMHPIPIFRSSLLKLRMDMKDIIRFYGVRYKLSSDVYFLSIELV